MKLATARPRFWDRELLPHTVPHSLPCTWFSELQDSLIVSILLAPLDLVPRPLNSASCRSTTVPSRALASPRTCSNASVFSVVSVSNSYLSPMTRLTNEIHGNSPPLSTLARPAANVFSAKELNDPPSWPLRRAAFKRFPHLFMCRLWDESLSWGVRPSVSSSLDVITAGLAEPLHGGLFPASQLSLQGYDRLPRFSKHLPTDRNSDFTFHRSKKSALPLDVPLVWSSPKYPLSLSKAEDYIFSRVT